MRMEIYSPTESGDVTMTTISERIIESISERIIESISEGSNKYKKQLTFIWFIYISEV